MYYFHLPLTRSYTCTRTQGRPNTGPQSLLNIMMMQGDSASRESFMKNSLSSSEFAQKAFSANHIVHLRKQQEQD